MTNDLIAAHNAEYKKQQQHFAFLQSMLTDNGVDVNHILAQLSALQIAIPSWALGAGGTRFGRFSIGGEPRNLEEKIADVALIKNLTGYTNSISLHIPWDIPTDIQVIKQLLNQNKLIIDSVNSNTFQDQPAQTYSYKFGSLCHTDEVIRQQAIDHNIAVIEHGKNLECKVLTVWLADGSNFPGQQHFRNAFTNTIKSLQTIEKAMPNDWTMLVEYKPYEPNFYSMVIPDWGTSKAICDAVGSKAKVLVDLGHHLPNTNIEQIVARLLQLQTLGGFHFNGSMYGDDDLTTGAIKPYQLFLIFNELVDAATDVNLIAQKIAYMIDASHNTKDPIADLLQSLENIATAYAKALLVNRQALHQAQQENNVVVAESILQDAFLTDVRPLLIQARINNGNAACPLQLFMQSNIRQQLINQRGANSTASGL
jgi:L-rhamnose isomerase / sugar isomerase